MRFSMRCPADVCRSQSTAADASRTIIAPRAPLALCEQCRSPPKPACAYADALATLTTLAAPRFLLSRLTDNLRATCQPWQREPLGCDAERPVRYEAESSLTCYEHTFMFSTCQAPCAIPRAPCRLLRKQKERNRGRRFPRIRELPISS